MLFKALIAGFVGKERGAEKGGQTVVCPGGPKEKIGSAAAVCALDNWKEEGIRLRECRPFRRERNHSFQVKPTVGYLTVPP